MLNLTVNGVSHELDVDPDTPLLWVIREQLALVGTKFGCGMAQCGACTVHLNGKAIRSCVTPVRAAAQQQLTPIQPWHGAVIRIRCNRRGSMNRSRNAATASPGS